MTSVYAPLSALPGTAAGVSVRRSGPPGTVGTAIPGPGWFADVNGNGFDDLVLLGLVSVPATGIANRLHVRFGGTQAMDVVSGPLAAAVPGIGFDIVGAAVNDRLDLFGCADVNGDGFPDLLLGAEEAGTGTAALGDGRAYVIFGGPALNGVAQIDLNALNGANGVALIGPNAAQHQIWGVTSLFGASVAGGDLDGDGIPELIVGAPGHGDKSAFAGGDEAEGPPLDDGPGGGVFVIFGTDADGAARFGGPGQVHVDTLGPDRMLLLEGEPFSEFGRRVSYLGDVNGDGIGDLLISSDDGSGHTVLFGGPALRGLGTVDASVVGGMGTSDNGVLRGFRITDGTPGSWLEPVRAPMIDFDGDGLADIVIPRSFPDGSDGFEILHGSALLGGGDIDLATLPAGQSTVIVNALANGFARGTDINGDGIEDLIFADPSMRAPDGSWTGGLGVVFGSAGRGTIDAAALDGANGFLMHAEGSFPGVWQIAVSDIDGDGRPELAVWSMDNRLFEPQPVAVGNRPPVARDDLILLPPRGVLAADLLADNGNGPDSDPEGDPLRVLSVTNQDGVAVALPLVGEVTLFYPGPVAGTVFDAVFRADGTVSVALTGDLSALAPDTGSGFAVTYVLTDGTDTATAVATFHHVAANAAPVAADDDISLPRRGPVTVDLFADNGHGPDMDPDGDPIRLSEVVGPNGLPVPVPAGGSATLVFPATWPGLSFGVEVRADGTATVTPVGSLEGAPAGSATILPLIYTVTDGWATDTAVALLQHVATNQPPVAQNDLIEVMRRDPTVADLIADNGNGPDTDPDGDPLRIAQVFDGLLQAMVPIPAGGAVTVAHPGLRPGDVVTLDVRDNGVVTFRPGTAFEGIPEGQVVTIDVPHLLSDGQQGAFAQARFVFDPVNRPPVARDDVIVMARSAPTQGNLLADNGNGPDTDPDGDPLAIAHVRPVDTGQTFNIAPGTSVTVPVEVYPIGLPPRVLEIEFASDGTFTVLPGDALRAIPLGAPFVFDVDYGVTDGVDGDMATASFRHTGTNRPPVAQDDWFRLPLRTGGEGNLFASNDRPPDSDPDGDPLHVRWVHVPGRSVRFLPENGSVTFDLPLSDPGYGRFDVRITVGSDGSIRVAPPANLPAHAISALAAGQFTYAIADGGEISAPATVTVSLRETNRPPVANDKHIRLDASPAPQFDLRLDTGNGPDFDPDGDPLIYHWFGPGFGRADTPVTLLGNLGVRLIPTAEEGVFTLDRGQTASQVPAGFPSPVVNFGYFVRDPGGMQSQEVLAGLSWLGLPDVPLRGTPQDDHLQGTEFDNYILGLDGNDFIDGGDGNDRLHGGPGDDTLIGGTGNDILDGGPGIDTAMYRGVRADFAVVTDFDTGITTVTDLRNPATAAVHDGTDRLTGIEFLDFAGQIVPLPNLRVAVRDVTAQPLQGATVIFEAAPLLPGDTQTNADGFAFLLADPRFDGMVRAERPYTPGTHGALTQDDALEVLRLSIGLEPTFGPATPEVLLAADFDRNGVVTSGDALGVLKVAEGVASAPPEWIFVDAAADLAATVTGKDNVSYSAEVPLAALIEGVATMELKAILLGHLDVFH